MWAAAVCALATALLWGIAFSILPQIKLKLGIEVVNLSYGLILMLVSLILLFARGKQAELIQLQTDTLLALALSLYVGLSILASFLFLLGYQFLGEKENPGMYNLIGSTYPIAVFLISYFYWHQTDFNFYLAVPGALLTFLGIGLLSFA